MSSFNIDISGGDFEGKFDGISKEIQEKIQQQLDHFGESVVADAKMSAPVDEGFLRNSITFDKQPLSVEVVVAANYAAYLEFGTRQFAASYVSSLPADWQAFAAQFKGKGGGDMEEFVNRLVEWVRRKGFAGTYSVKTHKRTMGKKQQETDDYAAAYQIALSIMRKGIKPHPFLYPAVEKNKVELINNLKEILQ